MDRIVDHRTSNVNGGREPLEVPAGVSAPVRHPPGGSQREQAPRCTHATSEPSIRTRPRAVHVVRSRGVNFARRARRAWDAALRVARPGPSPPMHARLQGERVPGTLASDVRAKTRRKREESDLDHRVCAPEDKQRRARR